MRRAGAASNRRGGSGEISVPGKYPSRSKAGERAITAGGRLAIGVERAHANPVVERLQGKMQIFVGLEFDDDEAAVAVEGEQIEHAAIAGRKRGDLRVEAVRRAEREAARLSAGAKFGLKPALGLRCGRADLCARRQRWRLEEQARAEFAAEVFGFGGERGFVGARAEGDFVLREQTSGMPRRDARGQTRGRAADRPTSVAERGRISMRALRIRREQLR